MDGKTSGARELLAQKLEEKLEIAAVHPAKRPNPTPTSPFLQKISFHPVNFLHGRLRQTDMSYVRDSHTDSEKHRLPLEENIKQLRRALQHWQTWDAEYEALKEEVEAVPEADPAEELRRIGQEFEGELLTGKELHQIFYGTTPKTKDQIINTLERRIDYVTKNIESLQKQLEAPEDKHAEATVVSQPDAADEEDGPITDIVEQLDDDDNVISYRLNTPGNSVSHVEAILDKAGVTDSLTSAPTTAQQTSQATPTNPQKSVQNDESLPSSSQPSAPTSVKKTVSFSDDTKPEQVAQPEKPDMSFRARRVEQIMKTAKEQESISKEAPIIPEDEDPEDAALRQQMLKYGMGEIGAVVAELELEEIDLNDSELEMADHDFDDSFDESDDDDAEDEYGRNGRVVTDNYRQRMLELEKKLGIASRSPPKAAPAGSDDEDDSNDEGIGRIVVNRAAEAAPSGTSSSIASAKLGKDSSPGKKGVRFAPSLDIAPEKEPAAPTPKKTKELVEPLSDIVERSAPPKPAQRQTTQKASRFKRARDGDAQGTSVIPKGPMDVTAQFADQNRPSAPSGPEGMMVADVLVERESNLRAVAPDEFDGPIAYQEVADEYQKMRRKFIQRQGGFLKEDESPVQPVVDEENQEPMSRFKAARLSRQ